MRYLHYDFLVLLYDAADDGGDEGTVVQLYLEATEFVGEKLYFFL